MSVVAPYYSLVLPISTLEFGKYSACPRFAQSILYKRSDSKPLFKTNIDIIMSLVHLIFRLLFDFTISQALRKTALGYLVFSSLLAELEWPSPSYDPAYF